MGRARQAKTKVIYRGLDISDYVMNFSYTDNYNQTDDISLTLSDRDGRWLTDLFPVIGDTLNVTIELSDWNAEGDSRTLFLGTFEIDNPSYSDTMRINAVAIPITSNVRSEKKNRAWVNVSLSGIAGDISNNAGMVLMYDTDVDPFYDNADQIDKSDLSFLEELCKSDGLCMKITDGQFIVFEESKYESEPAIAIIKKGVADIIGHPSFNRNAKDVYKACEISYFCPKTDQTYIGYFEVPNAPDVGHTLTLRENYNSENDDINLHRKARARAREKNCNEWTCDLTLKGDIIYFTGTNIVFEGWGWFDGKYHITSCTYNITNSGFTVSLKTRRCLEGY